ncbi:MAG TPA: deoxyguanosinetriphosphate triphosphohydrolase [Thermomicrobiales bacterium]|nr:deoxyguanosinetriphosphate triphosphohydrolase [Thermomicrobiales bacterium]
MARSNSIRKQLEERERAWLAPAATFSDRATRPRPEQPSAVRTEFQRDRDRIVHSKSFRRLMHKTQVFVAPAGDHYRTRLTHTLEVTQIARTIGRALRLNEDLIEAIGLGHDLGHTPFGHAGEMALAEFLPNFRHNEQSLRVVDLLEKDGRGLNLTDQVRHAIVHHSKPDDELSASFTGESASLEGEVVRLADAIAYINHDWDDAERAGIVSTEHLPPVVVERLGRTHAQRIDTLVTDVIRSSEVDAATPRVRMSADTLAAANEMRAFLFEQVYYPLNRTPNTRKAQGVIAALCAYYLEHIERMPEEYRKRDGDPPERLVADYVASMTDRFAIDRYRELYVPKYWD